MKNQRDLAAGWLRKAESDLNTAELVLASAGPYDDDVYWLIEVSKSTLAYDLEEKYLGEKASFYA